MECVKLVENPKICIKDESSQITEIIVKLSEIVKWINEQERERKE